MLPLPLNPLHICGSCRLEFVGNANRTRMWAQLAVLSYYSNGCLFGFNRYIKVLLATYHPLQEPHERVIICKSNALNFLPRFARLFINISRGSGKKLQQPTVSWDDFKQNWKKLSSRPTQVWKVFFRDSKSVFLKILTMSMESIS